MDPLDEFLKNKTPVFGLIRNDTFIFVFSPPGEARQAFSVSSETYVEWRNAGRFSRPDDM